MKTDKIRDFIHSINNLCHDKKIPVNTVDLDLLVEAAIQLNIIEHVFACDTCGKNAQHDCKCHEPF